MQSLHDYCFEDREGAMLAKIAVEAVAMLGIVMAGAALTLLGAPALLFLG